MTEAQPPYELRTSSSARRTLSESLPEAVAAAVWEFATGPLRQEPSRVGKPLQAPLLGTWSARRGTYRILYQIDDDSRTVLIVDVSHRRDTYRRTT